MLKPEQKTKGGQKMRIDGRATPRIYIEYAIKQSGIRAAASNIVVRPWKVILVSMLAVVAIFTVGVTEAAMALAKPRTRR